MELLLWLYLFDNRWFFSLSIPLYIYKLFWLYPLTIHVIEFLISLDDLSISAVNDSLDLIKTLIYNRCIFSFLISLNIMLFLKKISTEHEKENYHIHQGKKAYPILKTRINEPDFWIRRNSLLSRTGLFLLFLGFVSLIWSYQIITQLKSNDMNIGLYYINTENLINAHSCFILYSNLFVFCVFALMVSFKIIFNILGHYFPHVFVKISKMCYRKKSSIRRYHKASHFNTLKPGI
jgi:hypothetical protein